MQELEEGISGVRVKRNMGVSRQCLNLRAFVIMVEQFPLIDGVVRDFRRFLWMLLYHSQTQHPLACTEMKPSG